MKTSNIVEKFGYSKGQAEAISGIIIGAVLLFVGLFMVSAVSEVTSESTLKEYRYTTVTNSTDSVSINTTLNGTHKLTIGTIVSISGDTPDKTLTVIANNSDTSNKTITVYLNDVSIGTFVAVKSVADTSKTFTGLTWVANTINNLTYVSAGNTGDDLNIESAVGKYPSSKVDSSFGDINTSLISTMGTVFSVLGLVLIVIALALAIGALKGSMIGGGQPVA